jgi:hypothetical protein
MLSKNIVVITRASVFLRVAPSLAGKRFGHSTTFRCSVQEQFPEGVHLFRSIPQKKTELFLSKSCITPSDRVKPSYLSLKSATSEWRKSFSNRTRKSRLQSDAFLTSAGCAVQISVRRDQKIVIPVPLPPPGMNGALISMDRMKKTGLFCQNPALQ